MDHWHIFTFTVLGFNFLVVAIIGAILLSAARRDHPQKRKHATEPCPPKLTSTEARAIVNGEMHPLEAWRLGACLSREELGKISRLAAETLDQIEACGKSADQATQQAIIAAMLTGEATTAAQSTSVAHPATGADTGSSSSGGTTGSDGAGGAF